MRVVSMAVLGLVLLAGCGKEEKPVVSSNAVTDGSPCPQSVITDYNQVVDSCKEMKTRGQAKVCKTSAENFVAKYPSLNCAALSKKTGTKMQLTDANVRKTIDELTKAGI